MSEVRFETQVPKNQVHSVPNQLERRIAIRLAADASSFYQRAPRLI